MVDKEIKTPSSLIILWSPSFTLGLELVDKEIKRPSSLFSRTVLTSDWWRNGQQRNQKTFLFDYLVKCFLHTCFRTGRQRNQEASSLFSRKVLTSHLIKKWSTKKLNGLSLWFSCEVLSSYLVLERVDKENKRPSSLTILWSPFFVLGFRTGRQRNQVAFIFVFSYSSYFALG